MKKLLIFTALLFGTFIGVQSVNAQVPPDRGGVYQRHDRGRHNGWDRTYTVKEYRYVRYGYTVYKETYLSRYNRYGFLVSRFLIDREQVRDYDNYRDRGKYRFNVFLRF